MNDSKRRVAPLTKVLVATNAKQDSITASGTYTPLKELSCASVTFFAEAKDLNIVQRRKKLTADDNTVDDTNTNYVVVKANTVCKFSGLVDASELYVATSDSSTYTVRYRTEW